MVMQMTVRALNTIYGSGFHFTEGETYTVRRSRKGTTVLLQDDDNNWVVVYELGREDRLAQAVDGVFGFIHNGSPESVDAFENNFTVIDRKVAESWKNVKSGKGFTSIGKAEVRA